MPDEYEIINHQQISHFRVFMVNLLYRTPHLHKDFELCLILEGKLSFHVENRSFECSTGDFFLVNPFQVHELKSDDYALILSVQVSPSFFQVHYPQLSSTVFSTCVIGPDSFLNLYKPLREQIILLARAYLKKRHGYELDCASIVNRVFYLLVTSCPGRILTESDIHSERIRQKRVRALIDYIDENYSQKLLLSDIAEREGLTVTYLSHFFKDSFGISFQEYLMRIRCERARHLLLLTDLSLLDISMTCGFSDPKYFNSGFKKQYGCSPKEYRKHFIHDELPVQQKSILTTQEFLSENASRVILERHFSDRSETGTL